MSKHYLNYLQQIQEKSRESKKGERRERRIQLSFLALCVVMLTMAVIYTFLENDTMSDVFYIGAIICGSVIIAYNLSLRF